MPPIDDDFATLDADAPESTETVDGESTLDVPAAHDDVGTTPLSSAESDALIVQREALAAFLASYAHGNDIAHFFNTLRTQQLVTIGADLVAAGHVSPTEVGAAEHDTSREIRASKTPRIIAMHVKVLVQRLMS